MTEATASPSPAKAGIWEDFIDIFYQPSQVFERRRDGKFGMALLALVILSGVLFLALKNGLAPVMDAEMAKAAAAMAAKNPQITADQIRTCPECGSLFLSMSKPRTDRKRYCPYGRCAGNAATRAYRERESKKLKAKERIRSADRYERKVRKVFPKAKIKKRAHKTNKIDITKGGKPKKRMKSTE